MGAHSKHTPDRLTLSRQRAAERGPDAPLQTEARRRQALWAEFRAGQHTAQHVLNRGHQPRHAKETTPHDQ